MNFLADILTTADAAELEDLNYRVQEFTELISSLRTDVLSVIDGAYVTYRPVLIENAEMVKRAEMLNQDLTELLSRVEIQINRNPSDTASDLPRLKKALDDMCKDFNYINNLLLFHTNLLEAKRSDWNAAHLECSRNFQQLKHQLLSNDSNLKSFTNYQRLCGELTRFYSRASLRTLEKWTPVISWSVIDLDEHKQKLEVGLKINCNANKEQLINALYNFDLLSEEVEKFAKNWLNHILLPIIDKKCRILVTSSGDMLRLSTFNQMKSMERLKPCVEVLSELIVAFTFLHNHLDVEIGESSESMTFIEEVGKEIGEVFSDHLVQHCLEEAVPKSVEDIEQYNGIIEMLNQLDALLHRKGFLNDSNHVLLAYEVDVNTLMSDKISQYHLLKAQNLMKEDLFDSMDTGVKDVVNKDTFYEEIASMDQLCQSSFESPHLKISKTANKIYRLVEEMLMEACSVASKMISRTLYLRARQIIKMYCDMVPLYHKIALKTNPQYAAFFYNNCHFIAHKLPLLARKYKTPLSTILSDEMIVFCDLVPILTSAGALALRNQLCTQKRLIIDTLRNSGLVTLMESTDIPSSIEDSISAVCRQIGVLQSVWKNVLSTITYCRVMGYLCNACVEELTHRVCSYCTIGETRAKHLVHVFNIVVTKLSVIFEDPQEIAKNVKLWLKFKETINLLGGDLNTVETRWQNGKGPLAQEFSAQEVKKLIRATCSGSTKRAALLASIN